MSADAGYLKNDPIAKGAERRGVSRVGVTAASHHEGLWLGIAWLLGLQCRLFLCRAFFSLRLGIAHDLFNGANTVGEALGGRIDQMPKVPISTSRSVCGLYW